MLLAVVLLLLAATALRLEALDVLLLLVVLGLLAVELLLDALVLRSGVTVNFVVREETVVALGVTGDVEGDEDEDANDVDKMVLVATVVVVVLLAEWVAFE